MKLFYSFAFLLLVGVFLKSRVYKIGLTVVLLTFNLIHLPAQTIEIDSIYHDGQYRYYGIYLPPSYDENENFPVVMTLHGGGGTAVGTIGFTEMNEIADTAGFLVVYPQGVSVNGICCSWAAGVGSPADQAGIDDLDFFSTLIDTLKVRYAVDSTRIFATGLSQGGYMSQRLACRLSNKIAGVAPLCSNLDLAQRESCTSNRPVPILIINGTEDILVPYNGGTIVNNGYTLQYESTEELVTFWANKSGCNLTPVISDFPDTDLTDNSTVTRFVYSGCNCNTELQLYRVNGGGHTWPGVESLNYEAIAGETNEDIHASEQIWNFFKRFQLDCYLSANALDSDPYRLAIVPNPSLPGEIKLIGLPSGEKISIYRTDGKEIISSISTSLEFSLDTHHLTPGIYFVRVKGHTLSFVIQ